MKCQDPVGMDPFSLAFELDRAERCQIHMPAEHPLSRGGDEHIARRGGGLQAGSRVEHIAHDPSLSGRSLVGERLSAVDRDSHKDTDLGISDHSVELGGGFSHLKRGPHGTQRVVLVRFGEAECPHDGVTDELLDRPSMVYDRGAHRIEVPIEHIPQLLGVQAFAELGRADQVAEERRDRATTGFTRCRQARAALRTEFETALVLEAAGPACRHTPSLYPYRDVDEPCSSPPATRDAGSRRSTNERGRIT